MPIDQQNYMEKRDFMRMKLDTAITLVYEDGNRELEGLCKDLSGTGISIEVDHVIPIGTECHVTIHDGHTNMTRFQATIEVRRAQSTGDNRFILGAFIKETN